MSSSLKDIVIKHVKEQYETSGKVPSVNKLCKEFCSQGLNRKSYYLLFPDDGKAEMCRLAEVPIPKESFKRIEKATKAKEAIAEKKRKAREEDPEWKKLTKKKTDYDTTLKDIAEKSRLREEVKERALNFALTRRGQKHIFSSQDNMWCFVEDALTDHNPNIIEKFTSFCKERSLNPEKTLFETVSDLERYYINCKFWAMPVDEYIIDELQSFMRDCVEEEEEQALQEEFLKGFKWECPKCGHVDNQGNGEIYRVTFRLNPTAEGYLYCDCCKATFMATCPKCKGQMKLDEEQKSFKCLKCHREFEAPEL